MAAVCGLCNHNYEDPRVFPCLHSFCQKCIFSNLVSENRNENNDIFCPKCHSKFNIKPDEVQKLPQNFGITNLQPILKLHSVQDKAQKIECENCKGKKPAVGRCNDCRVFMCSSCSAAHKKIQTLQKHNMVTLETVKRAEPCQLAKQLNCQIHENEPMKLYCETCHAPICRDCTIFEHQNHNFKKMDDVNIQGEKRDISIAINGATNKIPGLENTLKDIKNMKVRILTKAQIAEKDVDAFIDTQIRILQQMRTELKAGVTTVGKTKLLSLSIQEEQVSQHLSNIKTGVQFARQAVSNGSESEILSVKEQIVTRLSDLAKKPYDPTPCQDDGIAFSVNHKRTIRDLIPELANLDSSTAMASLCSLYVIGGEANLMYTTFCDQGCEFVIIVRDHFGQRLKNGGSRVIAAITGCPVDQQEAWGTNMKFLELTDNDDGTYCVSYLPRFPGKYTLSVAIDKCHIRGSPFCWYVSQKLVNINKCKLESMLTNDGGMFQGSSTTIDDIVIDGGYCFLGGSNIAAICTHQCRAYRTLSLLPHRVSLSSQQSFFQGCKIGVKKAQHSLTNSETSFSSACESNLSHEDSQLSFSSMKGLAKDKWFWCDGFCYSPEDPLGLPSNITNFEDGDVFVLFLNPDKKTLFIYNRESEQKDCLEGIEFPVRPFLKG